MADRHGPERSILIAIISTVAGYVLLLSFGRMLPGLIAGIVLIDVGVQSGHVANQSRIYGLAPAARSRINTFYMVAFFLGGSLGSSVRAAGFNLWGWTRLLRHPAGGADIRARLLHAGRSAQAIRALDGVPI